MSAKPMIDSTKPLKANVKKPAIQAKLMSESDIGNDQNGGKELSIYEDRKVRSYEKIPRPVIKLRLNTVSNTQKSLSRIIRAVNDGTIEREKARTLGFLIRIAFDGWKIAAELSIADRLASLEKALKAKENK